MVPAPSKKIASKKKPHEVISVLVLMGMFGGSLKITSEQKMIISEIKNSLKTANIPHFGPHPEILYVGTPSPRGTLEAPSFFLWVFLYVFFFFRFLIEGRAIQLDYFRLKSGEKIDYIFLKDVSWKETTTNQIPRESLDNSRAELSICFGVW